MRDIRNFEINELNKFYLKITQFSLILNHLTTLYNLLTIKLMQYYNNSI